MRPADPCRLELRPGQDFCAPCHEAAKRLLFGVGCAACKLDHWARTHRAAGRDGHCADCGGPLRRLSFARWVARMAAIRRLPGEPDALWAQCEQHTGRRIARRQRHANGQAGSADTASRADSGSDSAR